MKSVRDCECDDAVGEEETRLPRRSVISAPTQKPTAVNWNVTCFDARQFVSANWNPEACTHTHTDTESPGVN